MYNLVVFANPSELVDVPSCEGAAGEGARLEVHGSYFLNPVVDNIVPFAAVGEVLVVEVPAQYIDVSVVEADGVRGSSVLQFAGGDEGAVLEVVLVDVGGLFIGGVGVCAADEVDVAVGDGDGLVEVGQFEVDVEGDGLELGAALEVEVVEDVLVVLEEMEVLAGTVVAETVHADDLLPLWAQALLAGLTGKVGALVLLALPLLNLRAFVLA
jgi:hypothetical protein